MLKTESLKNKSLKLKPPSISSIPIKEDGLTLKVILKLNVELKAAMVSLGFDSKNGAIFQMITDLDSDGNGSLDFNEFLGLMTTKISDRNTKTQYQKVFNMYDDGKNGYLTVDNLARVANELGETVSAEELGELIRRADTDKDGVVSEEEFYAIMTRQL